MKHAGNMLFMFPHEACSLKQEYSGQEGMNNFWMLLGTASQEDLKEDGTYLKTAYLCMQSMCYSSALPLEPLPIT